MELVKCLALPSPVPVIKNSVAGAPRKPHASFGDCRSPVGQPVRGRITPLIGRASPSTVASGLGRYCCKSLRAR
jgi:hypothetical protein